MRAELAAVAGRLPDLMLADERRIGRRLENLRRLSDPRARAAALDAVTAEVATAEQRVARRRAGTPVVGYPPELPISQRKDDIRAAIDAHQVVIVAGETGSGKTTQLPKVCLELGRGVRGMIGHTQPRRLAARTVAERIAQELDVPLGGSVGYKVRFTDRVGELTMVKLMTDGILLAELGQDRWLRQYDTLIIDEAHERSLNIDFILGYLHRLLPRRPDLKVVITSATIDPARFAAHFGGAPVVEVSGRTYPVQVRYRPIAADEPAQPVDRDQTDAICDAVDELRAEGGGDILVFLSGEREIRDTADALGKSTAGGVEPVEILPLYARLSTAEQHRVFAAHQGRRVVLATNVAETSLTVPGIKYVVDPGTARISRYSNRLKVQRLPIEPISQASANQRKGRCGRTSDGICIRLYSEADYLARPAFTEPEIVRTNLASVILQMTALGLGEVDDFPFIDPPDRRQVADGVRLLHELGALDPAEPDPRKRLTPLGRTLAQLPIDPRLARMVQAGDANGCLREVLVIAAALSIQDPRERPSDRQQAADEQHARFADAESDFLTLLNLWRYLRDQQGALSSSQFRRMCRAEYLNYLRVREWQDLYGQLRQVSAGLGLTLNTTAGDPVRIHQSLLTGLLSHVGFKDTQRDPQRGRQPGTEYLGARGARFAIFPGSALFRRQPRWVMAAELVETSRLWARVAARIEPEWVEPLAAHLVQRSYSEPHWDAGRGAVMGYERVTLYGLPVVVRRPVNFARIDPVLSRELFIRHALVAGEWTTHHSFFHHNRRLLTELSEWERRSRRRDLVVDDETLFELYDRRIPAEVVSARHFDRWWKKAAANDPGLLTFDRSMLVAARDLSEVDYPGVWEQDGLRLPLAYRFEPGAPGDGVTVEIPLALLGRVSSAGFDWQIRGFREELVVALIRSLPKQLRREFVPVPDYARDVLANLRPAAEPLLDGLERELRRLTGVVVPRDAWLLDRVPDHLKINFRVTDEAGRAVDEGRDLAELKHRLRGPVRETLAAAAGDLPQRGLRGWTFGTLPASQRQERAGHPVTAFPALVDEGDSVAIQVFETEAEQRRAMWAGVRRLLLLAAPPAIRLVQGRLSNADKLALGHNPHGGVAALLDDCAAAAVDRLMEQAGGPPRDEEGFNELRATVRARLGPALLDILGQVRQALAEHHTVVQRLAAVPDSPALAPALADIRSQLSGLIHPGFVTDAGWRHLPHLPRYLTAVARRLDKLPADPHRDRERMLVVQRVQREYDELAGEVPADSPTADGLSEIRWMIEELRVSSFAQALGTAYPVSEKRIYRAMDDLVAAA